MRFQYSTNHPSQDEFDSLPRIPLILRHNNQGVEVVGLVDICGLQPTIFAQKPGFWASMRLS